MSCVQTTFKKYIISASQVLNSIITKKRAKIKKLCQYKIMSKIDTQKILFINTNKKPQNQPSQKQLLTSRRENYEKKVKYISTLTIFYALVLLKIFGFKYSQKNGVKVFLKMILSKFKEHMILSIVIRKTFQTEIVFSIFLFQTSQFNLKRKNNLESFIQTNYYRNCFTKQSTMQKFHIIIFYLQNKKIFTINIQYILISYIKQAEISAPNNQQQQQQLSRLLEPLKKNLKTLKQVLKRDTPKHNSENYKRCVSN
eukprot:TRINITY_DN19452_c0_g2_i4.p3 TRINITY_DN19452_c0_g2~~TRINITY_DN19452_c0_g2_i4.p3  ORF type:complete len:255 (+),score=-10.16 TRINITY_DN19452_c0_g2_i4:1445-2209(+)